MSNDNRLSKEEIARWNKMTPEEHEAENEQIKQMERDLLKEMRKAGVKI